MAGTRRASARRVGRIASGAAFAVAAVAAALVLLPAGDHLVTHRIAWIGRDAQGRRLFRTKGDANQVADPWTFRLDRATQARLRFGVPYVGFGLAALGRRDVRMGLIGLPAGAIAAFSFVGLWRRLGAGEEAEA